MKDSALLPRRERPSGDASDLAWIAVSVLVGIVIGFVLSIQPPTGILLALAVLGFGLMVRFPSGVAIGLTVGLVGGAMALGYGFANIGFSIGPIPIPLPQVLLLILICVFVGNGNYKFPRTILLPLVMFVALIIMRLVVDFGDYRVLAVRDATIAIDFLAVIVGYHAYLKGGHKTWLKALEVIFVASLIYGSMIPFREYLWLISPTVGLQQSVPLLGNFQGIAVAVGAGATYFAVYSVGVKRILLLVWCLAIGALTQSRGLYLALPVALLITLTASRRPHKRILLAVGAAMVVGIAALTLIAPLGIQGRLGEISPQFYVSHFSTLLGKGGQGSGTIEARLDWANKTMDLVTESSSSIIFGVGLGPDLAFGFQAGEQSVRKPHDDYLEIFARLGMLGFAIFCWLLVSIYFPIGRGALQSKDASGDFCAWTIGSSSFFLVIAATQPLLAYAYGSIPLFFFFGMGVAASNPKSLRSFGAAQNFKRFQKSQGAVAGADENELRS